MFRDRSDLFPPDPNAPQPPPGRGVSLPRRMLEAPAAADQTADALERELAQVRLIGPAAGAELRRIVYGPGEHERSATTPGRDRTPRRGADTGAMPIGLHRGVSRARALTNGRGAPNREPNRYP